MTAENLHTQVQVLKTELRERDKALEKQAREYERRLEDLNHAHALAQQTLNTYIPRETYSKDVDSLNARVGILEIWKERISGGGATAEYITRILWAVFGGVITAGVLYALKGV